MAAQSTLRSANVYFKSTFFPQDSGMRVLIQMLGVLLSIGGFAYCYAQPPAIPIAICIGFVTGALTIWMHHKWPNPKPLYVAPVNRPAIATLKQQRFSTLLFAAITILVGLLITFIFPRILHPRMFIESIQAMGSLMVGWGMAIAVVGLITAPARVTAHNAWLASMGVKILQD